MSAERLEFSALLTHEDSAVLTRMVADSNAATEIMVGLAEACDGEAVAAVLTIAMGICAPAGAAFVPSTGPPVQHPDSSPDAVASLNHPPVLPFGRAWIQEGSTLGFRVGGRDGPLLGTLVVCDVGFPEELDQCVQALTPVCEALGRRLRACASDQSLQVDTALSTEHGIISRAPAVRVTSPDVPGDGVQPTDSADITPRRGTSIQGVAQSLATVTGDQPWETAIAAMGEGVIVQDVHGRLVAHNPAAASILGLTADALHGRATGDPGWHAIHPDGAPFPAHALPAAVALDTGVPVTDVVMGVCLPGTPTRWLNVTAVPLAPSGEDDAPAVVSTITDITGQISAQRACEERSSRLRQAIDAFPNPFFIMDAERDSDGVIVELRYAHVNLAGARLYGCRVEDIVGRGQIELFPSVVELGVFARYVAVIETGQSDIVEIPWFEENGVRGAFEVVVSRLDDSMVLTATEISARRTLVTQLAASEARFLGAFGEGAVPMALLQAPTDSPGRVVLQVNSSMCRFLGREETELVGPIGEGFPPGLGRVLADFETLISTAVNGTSVDCQFHHASGDPRWGEVRMRELGDTVAGSTMWLLQCSDTTDLHRIEDELTHNSRHDQLTGLANRAMLIEELGQALVEMRETRRPVAVLVVNLDDFKSVNAELGLETGDDYLVNCATLLSRLSGPHDQVARLGGDEFAMLVRDVRDSQRLGTLAELVLSTLADGVELLDRHVSAPASLGLAVARRASTAETLLSSATAAMREAKARGGNRWALAKPLSPSAHSILQIEADLREAVQEGGLTQRYQPLYDLRSGRLESVEALARWVHPTHGIVPPDEFIRIAERRKLIGALGDWALETACIQWASWHEAFGTLAPQMAVNVSTRQLGNRSLAKRIAGLLTAFHMPADQLWLEVTESQALTAGGPATAELAAIRESGVRISVDDFGTGYAGFSYLKTLPADQLKVDKTFVDDVDSNQTAAAIATSMIALGRGMGLTVVAEGIETATQLAVLRALGADIGQGWLWSPALAPADLEKLIGKHESEVRTQ